MDLGCYCYTNTLYYIARRIQSRWLFQRTQSRLLSQYLRDIEPEVVEKKQITVDTARIDPRFPATNQARHCFVKYNEAHKCLADRGEDDDVCKRLARDYRAICPVEWLEKWNEARENGTWWGKW